MTYPGAFSVGLVVCRWWDPYPTAREAYVESAAWLEAHRQEILHMTGDGGIFTPQVGGFPARPLMRGHGATHRWVYGGRDDRISELDLVLEQLQGQLSGRRDVLCWPEYVVPESMEAFRAIATCMIHDVCWGGPGSIARVSSWARTHQQTFTPEMDRETALERWLSSFGYGFPVHKGFRTLPAAPAPSPRERLHHARTVSTPNP